MYQSNFFKHISEYRFKFWLMHLILPVISVVFLLCLYPATGLDALLTQPFYDAKILAFPLKHDWFLQEVMHTYLKYSVVLIALTLVIFWLSGLNVMTLISSRFKCRWLQRYHQQFLWVFVAMLISTTSVSILKHFSNHACPWDLLIYGGDQPLFALFEALPFGAASGHCFPGGHAAGGFSLMAFYFGFRDTDVKIVNIRLANIGLAIALILGLAMGWAQVMRGAHFMSHNLWTAWIIWMILLAQYLIWKPNAHREL